MKNRPAPTPPPPGRITRMRPRVTVFLAAALVWACLAGDAGATAANNGPDRGKGHTDPILTAVDIVFVAPYPGFDQDRARALVAALIPIQPAAPLDPARVQVAIGTLAQSGLFAAIDVDAQPTENTTRLQVRLTPARRIRAVSVKGHYPLFEKNVVAAMAAPVGGAYRPQASQAQAQRIAALYRNEGFADPRVTIKGVDRPESGLTDVEVTIAPGPHLRLASLAFEGNRRIGATALKTRMRTWRRSFWPGVTGRFLDRELDADVDALRHYLHGRGHAAATVTAHTHADPSAGRVDATLTIAEGPLFRTVFEGNTAIGDRHLRKDIFLAKEGVNDAGLRRSARNMVRRYHEAGFVDARVAAAIEDLGPAGDGVKTIRFTVEEGPRTLVQGLVISGNRFVGEKQIREQVVTGRKTWNRDPVLVKETLDEDILAVERLYLAQGFAGVRVGHRLEAAATPPGVILHLDIAEGPRTLVAGVKRTGADELNLDQAVAGLKLAAGEPFREYMLDSDRNALTAAISEKGFPHVRVSSDVTFSPDRSTAHLVFHIDTGPAVTLAGVVPSGNLRTADDIVVGALDLTPGRPFSLQQVQQGRRRLARMAVFEKADVQVLGLRENAETAYVMANVVEKKPYYGQTAMGFESHRGLFAEMRAGDRNLWGRNKHVWVDGQISQIGYRGQFGLTEPALFGWPLVAGAGGWTEQVEEFNQEFGTRSAGGSLMLSQNLGDRTLLGLGFTLEQREQFRSDNRRPADPEELEKRSLAALSPSLRYDGRDDFIRPTKGVFAAFSIDLSTGLDTGLDDFVRYRSDLRVYTTPWRPLTLALMGRAGLIDPWSRPGTISEDQLFFMGGIGDVRGYAENMLLADARDTPVGGRSAWSATVEARIDLGAGLEVTGFMDGGRLTTPLTAPMGGEGWRSSIGMGLRYHTPIGPIGLLYGHKLDRLAGESPGRFHFAIGYTF